MQIPDHYGHLFGDVYYDKRARYALLEGAGAILLLLPPGVFSDIFRTPLRWLLENNPRALLWVLQNYQMIGFGIFIAGIASRITIDPEPIEIEREVSEETTEGTNKETIEETSEETTEETSEEDKSFFTLYWLGLD